MAKKKKRRKKKTQRKGVRRGGRPSRLAGTPTSALRAELERRESQADELRDQRDALLAEADEIDQELAALGAQGARRGRRKKRKRTRRGRPRKMTRKTTRKKTTGRKTARKKTTRRGRRRRRGGGMSLADHLEQALRGKTMSIGEATEAVQKSGYKTTSPNLRTMVNQQLLANPRFKKVARGEYTAK